MLPNMSLQVRVLDAGYALEPDSDRTGCALEPDSDRTGGAPENTAFRSADTFQVGMGPTKPLFIRQCTLSRRLFCTLPANKACNAILGLESVEPPTEPFQLCPSHIPWPRPGQSRTQASTRERALGAFACCIQPLGQAAGKLFISRKQQQQQQQQEVLLEIVS